jgi:DNA-binding PadR family transcriptional regulator
VVLGLLAEGPGHGYDLTRSLEARTQGAYAPDPAEIYPTLAMLEDEGFIDVTPDADGRKLYAVNAFGRASLADERVAADAAFTRLDAAAALRRRFKEGAWGVFQHIAAAMGPRGPAAARKDI